MREEVNRLSGADTELICRLVGSRMTDSLSLYPEVVREEAMRTTGALLLIAQLTESEPDETRPELNALYGALESRLQKAGGVDAVVPQNASTSETPSTTGHSDAPQSDVSPPVRICWPRPASCPICSGTSTSPW